MVRPRFHVLVTRAGIVNKNLIPAAEESRLPELLQCRDAGTAFRRHKHSFVASEILTCVHHLDIGNGYRCSSAFSHSPQRQKITQRLRHTQTAGDSGRPMPELAEFGVPLKSTYDGLAAFSLHTYHLRTLFTDPSELLEFVKSLPHANHSHPASRGVKDGIRQCPSELLSSFDPHGLFTFDAVGLFERRDIEPTSGRRAIGHAFAAVGDQIIDESHFGPKRFCF